MGQIFQFKYKFEVVCFLIIGSQTECSINFYSCWQCCGSASGSVSTWCWSATLLAYGLD